MRVIKKKKIHPRNPKPDAFYLHHVIESGLVGSTDFHYLSGRGAARAEDAQGTPIQSHIPSSILVYEDEMFSLNPKP